MKIYISFGIILMLLTIVLMLAGSVSPHPEVFNTWDMGYITGIMLMSGIMTLNTGISYDTKKKKWGEY